VRAAPAVSRARAHQQKRTRAYRSAEASRPSLRNGFTAYFVLSPVNGSIPPCRAEASARFDDQHRGVRTTRLRRTRRAHSSCAPFASTASHRTFVTIASRPSLGETRSNAADLPDALSGIFLCEGWNRFSGDCPSGSFAVIPGRAKHEPESILPHDLRPNGFSDVQLHIIFAPRGAPTGRNCAPGNDGERIYARFADTMPHTLSAPSLSEISRCSRR